MHDERFGFWFAGPRGPRGFHGRRGGHGRGFGGGFPGGGDWASMFRERPPRAERGGVRYLVLDAIADQPRHGYEIMSTIAERSGGSYKPSPGVIYPTLQMLEELGHVKVTERDDKKVYTITAAGKADLEEHRDEVEAFYEQSEDVWEDHVDELREFMLKIRGLVRAFRRSARRGRLTPKTMAKVRGILDEAIAKLESAADE
ncbi:MAG: PadR family transcriptional regulator [Kofleriaceae bacterium]|nr:PadR family transcriptional regulator [Kofleriaceae bacterium]